MTRVKYIDCIKFFAIIAVVFYHAGYLKYGYLGVDIFLVVNGYFITKVLERQYYTATSEGRKCSFFREGITFLSKRILRLLPLLIIAGIVCMLWGYFVMLPDAYENLGESVVATNLFSNNVLEAIVSKDYWALNNNFKPLMHTWYVGIIFEYYVFYYILHFYSKKATLSGGGMIGLKHYYGYLVG